MATGSIWEAIISLQETMKGTCMDGMKLADLGLFHCIGNVVQQAVGGTRCPQGVKRWRGERKNNGPSSMNREVA